MQCDPEFDMNNIASGVVSSITPVPTDLYGATPVGETAGRDRSWKVALAGAVFHHHEWYCARLDVVISPDRLPEAKRE